MDEDERSGRYLTAVTTEHFGLQSQAASTITEANSRASMYLMVLSSLLVALGFTSGNRQVFPWLAGAMIPAVFVLGLFTNGRLVDRTISNLGYSTRMLRIYEYYATLAPEGRHNFPIGHQVPNEAQTRYRIKHRFPFVTTAASMIGAVNAMVGGAAVAFILGVVLGVRPAWAVTVGAVIAAATFGLVIVYQHVRFARADAHPVDDAEGEPGS